MVKEGATEYGYRGLEELKEAKEKRVIKKKNTFNKGMLVKKLNIFNLIFFLIFNKYL